MRLSEYLTEGILSKKTGVYRSSHVDKISIRSSFDDVLDVLRACKIPEVDISKLDKDLGGNIRFAINDSLETCISIKINLGNDLGMYEFFWTRGSVTKSIGRISLVNVQHKYRPDLATFYSDQYLMKEIDELKIRMKEILNKK